MPKPSMTARDEAIEAATKAWWEFSPVTSTYKRWGELDEPTRAVMSDGMAAALAAAVPVLLNDLADRIDKATEFGLAEYNCGVRDAAELVRAAAEGWGQ